MLSNSIQKGDEKNTKKFPEKKVINAILLGSKSVGKTTIGQRLAGKFDSNILRAETYGIDFHFLNIKKSNMNIYVQIWDVNFQSYDCNNPKFFLENADILFLVFDDFHTFKDLLKYKKCISNSKSTLKYLISNKVDKEHTQLDETIIQEFVNRFDLQYYKISALKGIHFEEFKQNIIEDIRKLK
ncbi:MAG: hypothetical protein BAJALOKI1v1_1510002 [Promethearchaeota archaeon]|nr:MAG: hypothetical protein BAJALOKI1v1_1510002 [Candidatus Lokiarchaeota archaeon]